MPHNQSVRGTIAFVSQQHDGDWIEVLSAAMPLERVVADRELNDDAAEAVDIVVVGTPDAARLARYKNVKWIQSVWAGVERLLPITAARNLPLVRLIDPLMAHTMAESVLAWTLYLHRDMPAYAAQQRKQQWRQRPYRAAAEQTVGILGLGALGQAAAQRLLAAGYRVCGWSRHSKQIDGVTTYAGEAGLTSLLQQAQILVVLLPLTADTHQLLDPQRLAHLPQGAAVINFARGPILDTTALIAALDSAALSHAVLDVFATEPLPADNVLWSHASVTVLPHISAITNQQSASKIVATNIANYRAAGVLPVTVDVVRGY